MSKKVIELVEEPQVKSGTLPLKDEVIKIVESDWVIELLLDFHPEDDDEVYSVKFTSKCGETKSIYCLCSDLYDQKKKKGVITKLVDKGCFDPADIVAFIKYINALKKKGIITKNDEGYKKHISNISASPYENIAIDKYKAIVEHAVDNTMMFASKVNQVFREGYHGVILDDPKDIKKYGKNAIAILSSHFRDLVSIDNTKKLGSVLQELSRKGLFHQGDGQSSRSIPMKPGDSRHCYVFTIDPSVLIEEGGEDNV